MQDIVTLFGSSGAAAYLSLCHSSYRQPVYELNVLHEDGSVDANISYWLQSAQWERSDESGADTATFTLVNKGGQFDKYAHLSTSPLLAENRILQFIRGLYDPASEIRYILPACYVRIASVSTSYDASGVPTLSVSCLDLLKVPLKQRATSDNYENVLADKVAADIAIRYGRFRPSQINLNTGIPAYPDVQFPDYSVADMLTALYEPYLFNLRCDEAGNLVAFPRIGSTYSGSGSILGFADATAPPSSGSVAYTFSDAVKVLSISNNWGDHNFVNQVRVLGKQQNAVISLGAKQLLGKRDPSSIDKGGRVNDKVDFTNGGGGQNSVIAKDISVNFYYSASGDLTGANHVTLTQAGQGFDINDGGHLVGYVRLDQVTPTYIILRIEGRQYSGGGGLSVRHHGGMSYRYDVFGSPQVSTAETITVICDYNTQYAVNEIMPAYGDASGFGDIFGDHQTYQLSHNPLAMGTPVEVSLFHGTLPETALQLASAVGGDGVFVNDASGLLVGDTVRIGNPSTAPQDVEYATISLIQTDLIAFDNPVKRVHPTGTPVLAVTGVVSADGEYYSQYFKVDYERGRVVFQDMTYRTFTSAASTSGCTQTGGSAFTTSNGVDSSLLPFIVPQSVFQQGRSGDFRHDLTGFTVGQSYTVRLYLNDPYTTGTGQRLFSVLANGEDVAGAIDIYALAGQSNTAVLQEITGVTPDSSGNISLRYTQHNLSGGELDEDKNGGSLAGTPLVCAVEIIQPQGQGPSLYTMACGSGVAGGAAPNIAVSYGWSASQEERGVQNMEINNPLIRTKDACRNVGQYFLNYSAWERDQGTLVCLSVPHLQAGDIIKFYNPATDCDIWAYAQSISSDMSPSQGDIDTINVFILYSLKRS